MALYKFCIIIIIIIIIIINHCNRTNGEAVNKETRHN